MYLRWIVDPAPQREAEQRAQDVIRRNKEVRQQVHLPTFELDWLLFFLGHHNVHPGSML
jgi:hypothetical protein